MVHTGPYWAVWRRAGGRGSAGETPPIIWGAFGGLGGAGGVSALCPQRVPFAVARARDAILFVAEWRFLVRDEEVPEPDGDPEPERDGVWKEDEEPPAGIWDSWTPRVVAVAEASPPSEEVRGSPSPRSPSGPWDGGVTAPCPLCPALVRGALRGRRGSKSVRGSRRGSRCCSRRAFPSGPRSRPVRGSPGDSQRSPGPRHRRRSRRGCPSVPGPGETCPDPPSPTPLGLSPSGSVVSPTGEGPPMPAPTPGPFARRRRRSSRSASRAATAAPPEAAQRSPAPRAGPLPHPVPREEPPTLPSPRQAPPTPPAPAAPGGPAGRAPAPGSAAGRTPGTRSAGSTGAPRARGTATIIILPLQRAVHPSAQTLPQPRRAPARCPARRHPLGAARGEGAGREHRGRAAALGNIAEPVASTGIPRAGDPGNRQGRQGRAAALRPLAGLGPPGPRCHRALGTLRAPRARPGGARRRRAGG
uniref:Basic proline-rich protein-like n=1 Tax=Geospiza parvula TaxID=87175 RepID=A0A8U8B340_GEOPR